MFGKSINLLQPFEVSLAEKKRIFLLKIATIFLVVFYCLVVVAIFSFSLVTQGETKVMSDKIKLEQTKLSELQEIESLQLVLKQRLVSLSKIIDSLDIKSWLSYLEGLVPEGLSLEEIQWKSNGEVKLSGLAGNAIALSDFINKLKQAVDEKKIASSTLISATRQKEGTYNFSFEISIKD